MQVRLDKLDRIRAAGGDPYPVGFPRTATIAEIRAKYPDLAPDTATGQQAGVTGRVILSRIGGKLCFATIRDGTGDLQVMISLDRVGEQALAAWKRDVDLGDHVGAEGEVITSRSGELSVLADSFAITSKALRPLPDGRVCAAKRHDAPCLITFAKEAGTWKLVSFDGDLSQLRLTR